MFIENGNGRVFNVDEIGDTFDAREVCYLLAKKLKKQEKELYNLKLVTNYKEAYIPESFYTIMVEFLMEEVSGTKEEVIACYDGLEAFCNTYAGKTVNVFCQYPDWFILEDNNWCLPEHLLVFTK